MIYEIAHLEGLIDIDTVNKFRQNNDIFKSWSTDLMQQFPNGSWKTINGAKVFVNGGKVVAGLNNFNGMIDEFFDKKTRVDYSKEVGGRKIKTTEKVKIEFDSAKQVKDYLDAIPDKDKSSNLVHKKDNGGLSFDVPLWHRNKEGEKLYFNKIDNGYQFTELIQEDEVVNKEQPKDTNKPETKDPDKVEPAKKINVIPNGNTAFDKQAQSNIKNFLGKVKTKDRIKFANNAKEYDMFAVMDSKGDILKLTKSPQEAYQTALNSDIEDFHVVREKRDENEISYDYFNGSLFGDYDREKYDKSGNLKQEVKDSVIKEMSSHFKVEQKPVEKETGKSELREVLDKKFNVSGKYGNAVSNIKGIRQIYTDEVYAGKNTGKVLSKDAEKLINFALDSNIEGIKGIRDKYFSEWSKNVSKKGTQRDRYVPINTAKLELYNVANNMVLEAEKVNKSESYNINTMETINKALLTLEIGYLQGKVDNETIEKARQAKYFKREGTPGNYKYYYTKEEYNRAKGGQQTEIHHGKEKEETNEHSYEVGKVYKADSGMGGTLDFKFIGEKDGSLQFKNMMHKDYGGGEIKQLTTKQAKEWFK
jgi:hypothetical protein